MDWHQLFDIISKPDNIPIVIMGILVPFYTWYGLKQAFANDRVITQLEADKALAKGHHRKREDYDPSWDKNVHVWPYLLRIEFLATIVVMALLTIWSIALDAPLEEPANPSLTMNPSKAPWYFLGLQEMLVYFDPWIAGVVMPTLIIVGLMVIPYCDVNPLGNGYYTYKQRKFAIWTFLVGFLALWCSLIFIGVFIRGPGWMWFWPGQTWDHHRIDNETFVHLPELFGFTQADNPIMTAVIGIIALGGFVAACAWAIHVLYKKHKPSAYAKMNIVQYGIMQFMLICMIAMPVKMVLWHVFTIKYVLILPWFNI